MWTEKHKASGFCLQLLSSDRYLALISLCRGISFQFGISLTLFHLKYVISLIGYIYLEFKPFGSKTSWPLHPDFFLVESQSSVPEWTVYLTETFTYEQEQATTRSLHDSWDGTSESLPFVQISQQMTENVRHLFVFKNRGTPEEGEPEYYCLTCHLFSHIIRTVNFRAEPVCEPHVVFFTLPMRHLKCKRTSTYSHWEVMQGR